MRLFLALMLLAALPAAAQNRPAALGEFQSWTAATHQENGQKVCYAFARARSAAQCVAAITARKSLPSTRSAGIP